MPYFIASHPGSDLAAMIDLALFLKRNGYRPDQGSGLHPRARSTSPRACTTRAWTRSQAKKVSTARHLRDRKLQRAGAPVLQAGELLQKFAKRLLKAGRSDLIGFRLRLSHSEPAAEEGHRGTGGRAGERGSARRPIAIRSPTRRRASRQRQSGAWGPKESGVSTGTERRRGVRIGGVNEKSGGP